MLMTEHAMEKAAAAAIATESPAMSHQTGSQRIACSVLCIATL